MYRHNRCINTVGKSRGGVAGGGVKFLNVTEGAINDSVLAHDVGKEWDKSQKIVG